MEIEQKNLQEIIKFRIEKLEKIKDSGINPYAYNFNKKDILKLKDIAKKMNAFLVTTEKDYLRISSEERENIIFLGINLEINNKENFINELKKII